MVMSEIGLMLLLLLLWLMLLAVRRRSDGRRGRTWRSPLVHRGEIGIVGYVAALHLLYWSRRLCLTYVWLPWMLPPPPETRNNRFRGSETVVHMRWTWSGFRLTFFDWYVVCGTAICPRLSPLWFTDFFPVSFPPFFRHNQNITSNFSLIGKKEEEKSPKVSSLLCARRSHCKEDRLVLHPNSAPARQGIRSKDPGLGKAIKVLP